MRHPSYLDNFSLDDAIAHLAICKQLTQLIPHLGISRGPLNGQSSDTLMHTTELTSRITSYIRITENGNFATSHPTSTFKPFDPHPTTIFSRKPITKPLLTHIHRPMAGWRSGQEVAQKTSVQ